MDYEMLCRRGEKGYVLFKADINGDVFFAIDFGCDFDLILRAIPQQILD
jgi:hypothetical protein